MPWLQNAYDTKIESQHFANSAFYSKSLIHALSFRGSHGFHAHDQKNITEFQSTTKCVKPFRQFQLATSSFAPADCPTASPTHVHSMCRSAASKYITQRSFPCRSHPNTQINTSGHMHSHSSTYAYTKLCEDNTKQRLTPHLPVSISLPRNKRLENKSRATENVDWNGRLQKCDLTCSM